MEYLNELYRLDLAKLYYSDVLILIIVIVSLMVTIISFLVFSYLMFKDNTKLEDYESHKKLTLLVGGISLAGFLFIISVFRFAHLWNQTVTVYLMNMLK